eukprot:Sdes_comp15646_c0_seq1m4658
MTKQWIQGKYMVGKGWGEESTTRKHGAIYGRMGENRMENIERNQGDCNQNVFDHLEGKIRELQLIFSQTKKKETKPEEVPFERISKTKPTIVNIGETKKQEFMFDANGIYFQIDQELKSKGMEWPRKNMSTNHGQLFEKLYIPGSLFRCQATTFSGEQCSRPESKYVDDKPWLCGLHQNFNMSTADHWMPSGDDVAQKKGSTKNSSKDVESAGNQRGGKKMCSAEAVGGRKCGKVATYGVFCFSHYLSDNSLRKKRLETL